MRRIRIAAATVMVAAGLIGAVAAPASAEAPTWFFEGSCDAPGGPEEWSINATQKEFNAFVRSLECLPGTKDITLRTRL